MQSLDQGNVALMVLLDMSAAFDTVDSILLQILETNYGLSGTALKWFSSYFSCRSQFVSLEGVHSDPVNIDFGVPQGSCLGPICFTLYTSSLFHVIQKHMVSSFSYADDTQLIHICKPGDRAVESNALFQLERCIDDILHLDDSTSIET